jgi:hypothetical protein
MTRVNWFLLWSLVGVGVYLVAVWSVITYWTLAVMQVFGWR